MLEANVVGRVVKTKQNSQRLILVAGMVRSGSTWLYNAVRLVLARATPGVYGCWVDDFSRQKANAVPNVLIKLHAMDEDMASRADVVFTCHRDLRDVALSIQDICWTDDREKILEHVSYARACHEFWSERAALDLRYDSIVRTPLNVLRNIAEKLDADLSDEALEAVISDLDAIVPQPSSKGYDPVNLIHHHHRVDGVPGRWHGKIDDALRQEIEDTHTLWLHRFRYLPEGSMISVLGSPGYIDEEKAEDCAELIRHVGNNTGNLVFQHAIDVLLETDKKSVGAAGMSYGDPKAFSSSKYLLFPAANLLRPGVDFRLLGEFLKRVPVPLIILGLGAQADAVAPENEAIETITADPNVQLLADAIRSRAVFVSVRGPFSQRVCEALGIGGTAILGCPSLLLNPSPSLGADVAARLEEAREKADNGHIKLAITAAAPFEIKKDKLKVERILFRWAIRHHGIYVQQSGGPDAINFARQKYSEVSLAPVRSMKRILAPDIGLEDFISFSTDRQCIFIDARKWAKRMEPFDLVLGTRMHGNMIALASGVPCIHVAHDSRTSELIEVMKLPWVSMADVLESEDIASLIQRVSFDPDSFDSNRKTIAKRFMDEMERLGLPVTSGCRELALA